MGKNNQSKAAGDGWRDILLHHSARCSKCFGHLSSPQIVSAKRVNNELLFRCGRDVGGCPDLSDDDIDHEVKTKRQTANEGDSDLSDFLAEEDNDISDTDVIIAKSTDRRAGGRPSLLQEKFKQYEMEFASDDELSSSVCSEEVQEEEEEGDDDIVIIPSSSDDGDANDYGSESSSGGKDRIGKLYCSYCDEYKVEDDFSALQKRITDDTVRFCLRHSSTAGFNEGYRKPGLMKAVGTRLGLLGSPTPKSSVKTKSRLKSPGGISSSLGSQSKLDSFYRSHVPSSSSSYKSGSVSSSLKRRALHSELVDPSRSPCVVNNASPHKSSTEEVKSQRRSGVILDSEDESCEAQIQHAKEAKRRLYESDSDGEWDEAAEVETKSVDMTKNFALGSSSRHKHKGKYKSRSSDKHKRRNCSQSDESYSCSDKSSSEAEWCSDFTEEDYADVSGPRRSSRHSHDKSRLGKVGSGKRRCTIEVGYANEIRGQKKSRVHREDSTRTKRTKLTHFEDEENSSDGVWDESY